MISHFPASHVLMTGGSALWKGTPFDMVELRGLVVNSSHQVAPLVEA